MHPLVYNVCTLLGLGLSVAGVFLIMGTGPALLTAGSGLIGLTVLADRGARA